MDTRAGPTRIPARLDLWTRAAEKRQMDVR
jgi:hypothetical protein